MAGTKKRKLLRDGGHVYFVCLTGGPCGGKTSALNRLRTHFTEQGFRVFSAPEAATLLWQGGCSHTDLVDGERRISFQRALMQLQMQLEDSLGMFARSLGENAIVLCDRGAMDGRAYMEPHEWDEVLRHQGTNPAALSEDRYDAVLHLCTAADGASKFYSFHNNDTRRESVDEALHLDKRTLEAWANHPRRTVIDNTTDFEGKLQRVVDAINDMVRTHTPVQMHTTHNGKEGGERWTTTNGTAAKAGRGKGANKASASRLADSEKDALDSVLGKAIAAEEETRRSALVKERKAALERDAQERRRRLRHKAKVGACDAGTGGQPQGVDDPSWLWVPTGDQTPSAEDSDARRGNRLVSSVIQARLKEEL